jgi:hypothetical protein
MTELWGAWGFEHTIGACERYWQTVPADPKAKPLSLAWYRTRILSDIAFLRRIVALRDSSEPLPHTNLEFWLLSAMQLGRLTEEAVWRFRLGDDARLGKDVRVQRRQFQAAGARQRRETTAARDAAFVADVIAYRRAHPHASRTTEAIALLFTQPRRGGSANASDRPHAIDAMRKSIARVLRK